VLKLGLFEENTEDVFEKAASGIADDEGDFG
jgi:hypothetical protein